MPKMVRIYNLMLAAPGDAMSLVEQPIRQIVQEWNITYGDHLGIRIELKEWKSGTFPWFGKRPQAVINWQLLDRSDLVVAVFWTRFGTPTGVADSGVEEEILRALKLRLPLMLYFSDKPVQPSQIDRVQHGRVRRFRKKYQHKGLFGTFVSEEEFIARFRQHLSEMILYLRKRTRRR